MTMAMQVALLTRWEWFKLRRRWAPWIVVGFVMMVQLLVFWLSAVFGNDLSYQSPSENIANGLGLAAFFGPFVAVILASMVVGGEYGWGTLRPVLSKGAGRWQLLVSKVAVVVLFTAAMLIVLALSVTISGFIAEAALSPSESSETYGDISAADLLALYGRMLYAFLPYITLALFMVVLTGSNGVGIGLSMGYYIGEGIILVPILTNFSWSDQINAYLLGPNVSNWQSAIGPDINVATLGGISEMAHGFIFVTIYTLALGGAAIALFLRRDIAGAKGG